MVLVDTSVWIEFFRNSGHPAIRALEQLISPINFVCICGIIRQEILQGVRQARELTQTRQFIDRLPFLPTRAETYDRAAALYRQARQRGLTIPTADATIAAVAAEHHTSVFTLDQAHFSRLAKIAKIRLHKPALA